jgi:toxin FitB
LNVLDSSAWLEYFAGSEHASRFLGPLQDLQRLVVPAITVYEVFKVLLREIGDEGALQAVSAMQRAAVVDVTTGRAMSAAALSLKYSLPMADAIILAISREFKATLWTLDAHFEGMENVKYFSRKRVG